MLKILYIIPSLGKGGAERLVLEICRKITTQSLADILLVVMEQKNEYAEIASNFPIRYCSSRVIPSISGKAQVDIVEFNKIVKAFNPDIIHSHLFEAELLSRWNTFPNIGYVSHCHDNMRQFKRLDAECLFHKSRFTDFYERKLMIRKYRQCDNNFIAISKDTERFFKTNLPRHLQNIFLLPNAIDYNKFSRYDGLAKRSLSLQKVELINVGSFVDKKNQSFLIDVVEVLHSKGVNIGLTLLGDGPNRQMVENKIKENNLTDHIRCFGNVNNVEDFMHKADIYVHSALYEPFGLVLLEAMAAGLPVVCLDGKGNRDIMREKYNGFMIPKPDVELFAEKIIQLINDKDLYAHISENAESFAKDYDIKAYVEKLMQIYKVCKKA